MRTLASIALPFVLIACSGQQTEEPVVEETAAAPEELAVTTANGTEPGKYDVTWEDGTTSVMETRADGTYTATAADGTVINGTWVVTDGKSCFTPEGEDGVCWAEGEAGEGGSFTATSDEGVTVTVTPQAAAAAG